MSAIHIKQLPGEIAVSYTAGTNLLLLSKPGLGKSQTIARAVEMIAQRIEGFGHWRFDMTTATPNDLMAYMPDDKTKQLEAFPNGVLPNAYTHPDVKGIVDLDEVLNGDPTTTKVFQKYINSESIGGRLMKPKGVIVVMASNRMADKAGVMQQSRAFMSRAEQLEVYSDAAHNFKFADDAGWFPVLLKYLEKFPDHIDNYEEVYDPANAGGKLSKDDREAVNEEGKRGIWANMRSWERVSKLEYAALSLGKELNPARVLANVGKAVGQQYVTFRAMYDKIASVDEILRDPVGVKIPTKMDEMFVMVCMLSQLVPQDQMKSAAKFIDRLQGDIRALAIRRLVKRSQKDRAAFDIGATKEYKVWMQDPAISDLFMAAR
jgi:hypothetical protein